MGSADGQVLAVITRGSRMLSSSRRTWCVLDPNGRVRFHVTQSSEEVAARDRQMARAIGENVVGVGLALVTGVGFTSHRKEAPVGFDFYTADGHFAIGSLDRSVQHRARLRLRPEFGRHADTQLGIAAALLVDLEEPTKA